MIDKSKFFRRMGEEFIKKKKTSKQNKKKEHRILKQLLSNVNSFKYACGR